MEEPTVHASTDSNPSASTSPRKKRKWDQPAESLLTFLGSIPELAPLNASISLPGTLIPGMLPSLGALYPIVASGTSMRTPSVVPNVHQSAVAIVQKINQDLAIKGLLPQNKIHDELIAREIVINDAEPSVRGKLTKRQTQEEIQLKTGAVVITRGKYKPVNGPLDHEKPLYLHISAGTHLKDTAERIRAVDQAATLVEEMLRQGPQTSGSSIGHLGASTLSTLVFVHLDAGSHLDLVDRIRGPNDQYINHIMNETGAKVVLKGGSCEISPSEDTPQPLHFHISADSSNALEDARKLVEHLLETVRSEYLVTRPPYFPPTVSYNVQSPHQTGCSMEQRNEYPVTLMPKSTSFLTVPAVHVDIKGNRLGSSEAYSAVPPPKQLLTEGDETVIVSDVLSTGGTRPDISFVGSMSLPTTHPTTTGCHIGQETPYRSDLIQIYPQQSYGLYPQASQGREPFIGYSAYSGLYPPVSPLQQVALALQQSPVSHCSSQQSSPFVSLETYTKPMTSVKKCPVEKQEKQRRKFQELPLGRKESPIIKEQDMVSLHAAPLAETDDMQPQTPNVVLQSSRLQPSFASSPPKALDYALTNGKSNSLVTLESVPVKASTLIAFAPTCGQIKERESETKGIKLVEYAEDEDEDTEVENIHSFDDGRDKTSYSDGKPFWAV